MTPNRRCTDRELRVLETAVWSRRTLAMLVVRWRAAFILSVIAWAILAVALLLKAG